MNIKKFAFCLKIIACLLVIVVFSIFTYRTFEYLKDKNEEPQKQIETKQEQEEIKEELPKEEKYNVSLIMTGDALIHSAVYADAKNNNKYDFKPMLEQIKPIVEKHDLAFYNQETILGGTEIGLSTYPCFNSPYEVGDAFIDAGFNIVSLANNHTLDRGVKAITNSRNYWNKKDVLVSGSATSIGERNNIEIKEKNNIKYAMLAYTTTTNGIKATKDYHVNIYSNEQAKKDIEHIRDKTDIILVSMHWGEEYNHNVTTKQKEIATYLSSLGVDIIIGHHPHVVEPIEYINDTLVIYSLGNIISAQRGVEKLTGLMVSVNIEKAVINDTTSINISDPTAELIYTYSTYNPRKNFKLYPYTKLNDKLLPNYKEYYNKFMNIVTSKSTRVIPVKLSEG